MVTSMYTKAYTCWYGGAMSTTIRVSRETRDAVNRIRERTGESADSVLEKALAAYEEAVFWRRWHEVYVDGQPQLEPDEDMAAWEAAAVADGLLDEHEVEQEHLRAAR